MSLEVEFIRCHCGSIIAGWTVRSIDEEWEKERKNYLSRGFTVERTAQTCTIGRCRCRELLLMAKEALELVCSEYPPGRDGMDGIILPVGIKSARRVLDEFKTK